MHIRDAIRSFWGWFSDGASAAPGPGSDQPEITARPASETARCLSAANDYELSAALEQLSSGQRGYISAEDYEEITAEELKEFSVAGSRIIGDVAGPCGCTIDYRPDERRVYFARESATLK